MAGSLIDLFPPETQTFLGIAAAISAVGGLAMWGAGIKIARVTVAILLGVVAAALAAWGLPGATGIAPLTAALIGFVAGILAGAVTFRFLQGAILAAALALAVMGGYYHWQMGKSVPLGSTTTLAAAESPRLPENSAGGKAVTTTTGANTPWDAARLAAAAQATVAALQTWGMQHWLALPEVHRQRMAVLAVLTAIVALVLAVSFPRYTTWITTAAVGTLVLASAALILVQVYAPQYLTAVPSKPMLLYGGLLGVMAIGMLMQRLVFWPRKKRVKVLAVPVPGT